MKGIENIELGETDIAIFGSIVIAIVALLHTSLYSLFIVIPIVSMILAKLILFEIKNYKIKK